ncbi:ABC transporter substrate-binding protein [Amycolatopsis minnesotensis]
MSRRSLLATTALAAATVVGGCAAAPAGTGPGAWAFRDDSGKLVTSRRRPESVLCYLGLAAALWDHGFRCAGTYSALTSPDPDDRSISGDLDRRAVPSFGDLWGQVRLEKIAAARPDLVIVGVMRGEPLLADHDLAGIERLAPTLRIEMHDRPLAATLARVAELAGALGGTDRDRGAKEYENAVAALGRAVDARRDVRTAFVAGQTAGLDFNLVAFPTVRLVHDLGLPTVVPDSRGTAYTVKVSWENVPRYPADLILVDQRPYSRQPDQLAANPIWRRLPAVERRQVAAWNPEPVLSYAGVAKELQHLAEVLNGARHL